MSYGSRLLCLAGLALVLAGLLFGLGFSFVTDHEPRLVAFDAYQPVFETIARRGDATDWQAVQAAINARSVSHRRATDVHTHGMNLGVVLILLGLLAPVLRRFDTEHRRLLLGLVAAAWVYPCGLLLQFLGLQRVGEGVAALGAALVILAFALFYRAIARGIDTMASERDD